MTNGILRVASDVIESMELACKIPPGLSNVGRDETLFDEEYKFEDGMRMVIQVVASNDPDTESCWTQGVLLDEEGWEHGCTEVGESFKGEYFIGDYCVIVEPEANPENDEFKCEGCNKIFDIEDSIRVGKDELYCPNCK
jgi:uncharacterized protein YbaR (Trm112 family)